VIDRPDIRYAKTPDGIYLAYQVVGDGERDLVLIMDWWCCHLDYLWDEPSVARFLSRLASFARLILFDRRGMGASDRQAPGPMEQHVDDLGCVLDTVRSERAVLFGLGGGGMMAALFAATHPGRTDSLVMHGAVARTATGDDYPWGWDAEVWEAVIEGGVEMFNVESALPSLAPSVAGDARIENWHRRMQTASMSPGAYAACLRQLWSTDTRAILSVIQAPTLVLHPTASFLPPPVSQDLAARLPDARLVQIDAGMMPFFGGADAILAEVQEFLTGERGPVDTNRVLATVLLTDIVSSTARATQLGDRHWNELLDDHDMVVRRQLERFSGRLVNSTGDGLLATFDGPARAIRCGCALRDELKGLGLDIRIGVHTGEVELRGGDVGGVAVHIAARVEALASGGEVLVSRTVTDLVAGSGIEFKDRGEYELKGVPGVWRLFAVAE
jgi:class 3 adenylate cyclase